MNRELITFDRPITLAISESYGVLYAGWGNPPPGILNQRFTLITGEVAAQLYTAISGHAYGEHPENACWSNARIARSWINALIQKVKLAPGVYDQNSVVMAFTAQAVLIQWSNVLMPWLGITKLNECGTPVPLSDIADQKIIISQKQ